MLPATGSTVCRNATRGHITCPEGCCAQTTCAQTSCCGSSSLVTSLPALNCGNGQVDPGEECDDQNDDDLDGCDSRCHRARCALTCNRPVRLATTNRNPLDACDAEVPLCSLR